jgi:hypothetical protein
MLLQPQHTQTAAHNKPQHEHRLICNNVGFGCNSNTNKKDRSRNSNAKKPQPHAK